MVLAKPRPKRRQESDSMRAKAGAGKEAIEGVVLWVECPVEGFVVAPALALVRYQGQGPVTNPPKAP